MIGLFINMVPIRVQLNPAEPLITMMTRLQDQQSTLNAHQHLGLTRIQHLAGLNDLFDTAMVFENYPHDSSDLPTPGTDLRVTSATGRDATHYPLTLIICPTPHLRLRLDYRSDLFQPTTIEALATRFTRLLHATVADPHQPMGHIDILAPEERHQLLNTWNDTTAPIPVACLPELFEQQVARTPEGTAVVFEDTQFSYAQLNAAANQLAYLLITRGVGPEHIVALALPRSIDMIVAILGVLKAGAAYLPLDPDYPPARLAVMLTDAAPAIVITTLDLQGALPDNHPTPQLIIDDPHTPTTLHQHPHTNPTNSYPNTPPTSSTPPAPPAPPKPSSYPIRAW
jgi:pristinamycin I synthase-3/4